jgi:hypothetical protein
MIEIALLTEKFEQGYTDLLSNCKEATLFQSVRYRNLLTDFIGCKAFYLIAIENGAIIGALPAMIKENSEYGNILNSLPFFGGYGGLLIRAGLDEGKALNIKKLLLNRVNELASENNCVLSVIITSPFDQDTAFYEEQLNYSYKDYRVAQMVQFREGIDDAEAEIMFKIVEPDNRRAIRRPIKNEIAVEFSNNFQPLFDMHSENISSKGGSVKPLDFFQTISRTMTGNDYTLMYAKKDNTIIAGLLLFYFKDIVEYYTPALRYEFSVEQGTTLLIYEGMRRAIKAGYRYWNFGGTSPSQTGLHKFKSRWGATDYPYYYYVIQHSPIDKILALEPAEIMKQYKWFYVIPFTAQR